MHVKALKNAKTFTTFVLAFSVCWGPMFLAFVSTDVSDLICAKMLLFVFLTIVYKLKFNTAPEPSS